MIKKLLPVLLFVLSVIVIFGGGIYFYKQFVFKDTWTPIKTSTPQETFHTFLNAAYSHDEKAVKRISATTAELIETRNFGAFSKCLEIKPKNDVVKENDNLFQAEKEPGSGNNVNKTTRAEDSNGKHELSEDESVPIGVIGFVRSLNALNTSPTQIKVTDSQISQDEAVLTFLVTEKTGTPRTGDKEKALFKKIGDEWRIFEVLTDRYEGKDLNFAIPKSPCK